MSTTKLYKNDRYLKDCEAVITSVSVHGDASEGVSGDACLLDVTLDRTLFFPEGGGQSCDTGTIGDWKVTDVQESGTDEVIHTILWINGTPRPEPGDSVRCLLDWDRRFDNMQRHCGEHILSGIFYDMFGGVNRGFHTGQRIHDHRYQPRGTSRRIWHMQFRKQSQR